MNRLKVFITDANERSSLAVVRALGREGVHVGVGAEEAVTLAGSSKYCAERFVYPSPRNEPEGFQQFLGDEIAERGYEYILPTTDITTQLVSALKPRLQNRIHLLTEDEPTLAKVQDKAGLLQLADSAGIEVPRWISFQDHDETLRFAENVGYPVVVKPRKSRLLRGGHWYEGPVRYANTPQELIQVCETIHAQIPFPLVQEKLRGEGRGIFLLMWKGEVMAAFCHRRLREKPPWGGVSVLSESTELDLDLTNKSACLLRAVGWSGPAMVEFKNDVPSGRPKLMEVNGRFWGSLKLAVDSGINFPLIYLRLASGESLAPQLEYRTGVRNRWLLADFDALVTRLRASREQEQLYCSRVSRLRACADFLNFGGTDLHYDVYAPGDPLPAFVEWKKYMRTNLSLVFRRNGYGARK